MTVYGKSNVTELSYIKYPDIFNSYVPTNAFEDSEMIICLLLFSYSIGLSVNKELSIYLRF